MKKENKMKKKAFTLAEVLIVLGIIGIVASMTIPTLIQKVSERETVSKLKKVLFKIVNNIQKSDKIENREVLFLKGGIMLSKNPSGAVTIYDTKANENYVEITNSYLIYLILKEYETQQEQITQAIKSCANLEV